MSEAESAPAAAYPPRSFSVAGDDGLPLHGLAWSDEGVPLVLLHGFGNDAHIWEDFAPLVAPYYRTLALDLRGHGDSGRDEARRYDYDFHVRDLERAFDALGVGRLVLAGHSLGGRIATLFAGSHRSRLAGLVLVDSGPELDARGTTRIRLDMDRTGAAAAAPIASEAEYARLLSIAYPAARPEAIARMARHGLRPLPGGGFERKTDPAFHAAARKLTPTEASERERATTAALWDALGRVACPALVVRGAASDVLAADVAERMADDVLPSGRLAVVPRASHSVMTDNPEGFAEAVLGFVLGDD
jgi:pimeloyl-ACP methyl ester carboxylesterase